MWMAIAVSGIRRRSLMLFSAAVWPPFPDYRFSTDAAAQRAPAVSGSIIRSSRELRAVINIAG
jgi:hypothetical protein